MKASDALARLGLPATTRQDEVNPLRLALNYEFDLKHPPEGSGDHRKRAIDRCIRRRAWMRSEWNTAMDFLNRFVRAKCPVCGALMEPEGPLSGAGDTFSATYACPQKCCTFSITVPSDGMGITFPDDADPREEINPAPTPELAVTFNTAVEGLREYYPILGDRAAVAKIRGKIKWPETGAGEKEYLDIKDQVEKSAEDLQDEANATKE